ncbi:MAG: HAMP domain-containing sensor histidine kinase [Vicinamibacterales bacterium]
MRPASLHEFITSNRDEIITRCRTKVAARPVPPPTDGAIDGRPLFLEQLVTALRSGRVSSFEIGNSAAQHGHALLTQGFTISQVVHNYGDVCQAVTDLAVEKAAPITADDFRTLNRCLDDAIAAAVTQFGRAQNQTTLDGEIASGNQRLGFLAHELRNLLNTAVLAFEVLKTGNVGVGGSTGDLLHRSLTGLRSLISRSLAEVRLTRGVQNFEQFLVAGFLEEISASARLDANARHITLNVLPIEGGVAIEADKQVLTAVVGNILQNAFKFTKPHTAVSLRVRATDALVSIDVDDECGGLAVGSADELFLPFSQRDTNRTGLGLGLAFCRWGAEANHGRILVRDRPGHGCTFTVELPRLQVSDNQPALASA